MIRPLALAFGVAVAVGAAGCGAARIPPRRAVVWVDDDRAPFAPAPEERYAGTYWDAADHLLFRPASELWALPIASEAIDVNAVDEVPDSSFFTNRIGRSAMSEGEVARGACGAGEPEPPRPWTILGGKVDGRSAGFTIRAADGVRYVLKLDREGQPEQSTAADAIGAAIFHAAGYHVPCNRVVLFPLEGTFTLDPDARTSRSDGRRPITPEDVRRVIAGAARAPDGRRRAVLSRFVEGDVLGPWDFVGTWDADPNDVVPHERRRELRGIYVLDAWIDRWDDRQGNTLAAWIETEPGGGGHVRHYLIDFGEALGMMRGAHRGAPRMGHTTHFDLGRIVEDTLSLGIARRPWDGRHAEPVIGFFDEAHFDPSTWCPQYWNGALDRRTDRDVAWGARILARFDDARVHALVGLGRFSDPDIAGRVEAILLARRDRLLERYLLPLSPLADPEAGAGERGATICVTDLAVLSGLRTAEGRAGSARIAVPDREPRALEISRAGARLCAALPPLDGDGAPADHRVIELGTGDGEGVIRVHAYVVGRDRIEIVGLERARD